jgi:hypothetical protein
MAPYGKARPVTGVGSAYASSIDGRINLLDTHSGLDTTVTQILSYCLHLLLNRRVLCNTVLGGLRFSPLNEASVCAPLRGWTFFPRIVGAGRLVSDGRCEIDRVDPKRRGAGLNGLRK